MFLIYFAKKIQIKNFKIELKSILIMLLSEWGDIYNSATR